VSETEPVHNEERSRFEVVLDGSTAVAEYRRRPDGALVLTHTEVPDAFEGQGVASGLAQAVLDWARTEDLKVVPECRFMAAYVRRNKAYQDLVLEP
jgi:uncharacterized protein